MFGRRARVAIVALLLAGTAVAVLILRGIEQQSDALTRSQIDVTDRLSALGGALSGIATAQHRYVAPGQLEGPGFDQVTTLVRRLYDDTLAIVPLLHTPESATRLQSFRASIPSLLAADTKARENLRLGQDLMAADLVFNEANSVIERMRDTLQQVQAEENAAHRAGLDVLGTRRWTLLGAAAGVWGVMALLLALIPVSKKETPTAALTILEPAADPPAPHDVDLSAASDLCVALSKLTSTSALPALLGRAAAVLDASGVIIWVAAGEELFAAGAHGYTPQILSKIGAIPRGAENATAAAWRDARLTVVAADGSRSAAIVAPMYSAEVCVGVLSVELQEGRQPDSARQSIASMIASQLAAVTGGWPEASPSAVAR